MSSLTYQRSASKKRVSRRIRESKAVNYAEKARMLSEIERVGAWEVLSELERLERGRKG